MQRTFEELTEGSYWFLLGVLGCGDAVVEVSPDRFASHPSAPSPAGWMACPWMTTVHRPAPWRITSLLPVLSRSQSGWERQWKAERETKANWFFFPCKISIFWFFPSLFKIMQLCQIRWVYCLLEVKNRACNSLCGVSVRERAGCSD